MTQALKNQIERFIAGRQINGEDCAQLVLFTGSTSWINKLTVIGLYELGMLAGLDNQDLNDFVQMGGHGSLPAFVRRAVITRYNLPEWA